ncbi:MAG TPA: ABC transporter permease [Terracidiphilus sp.]
MDWFREVFRRHRRYDELSEQIREHLEEKIAGLMDKGLTRTEAEHTARREFGNLTLIEERSREVWQWQTLESAVSDIRFALRQLIKSPGFTITALLTLALGIGVNIAVFSVIDAVLLKPLPYKNADRLVMIGEQAPKERVPAFDTYREYEEWSRNSHSFEKLAGATWARNAGAILSWRGEKKEIMAVPTTVDFFSLLGVDAAMGRTFATQDLNSPCTVVLAHSFWEERLDSASNWIGKSLTLDGKSCTVVGVMPKDFSFYPKQTELWTLITPNSKFSEKPWDAPILTFGLLKPGISRPAAQAELASIQNRIIDENPAWAAMKLDPVLEDLQSEFTWLTSRNLHQGLLILFAVVGFVLLIACVNVANLLLGRATVRQKEFGVRAALGAGRSRLIRQLLTESVVLSLFGACLGVLFAVLCVRYITAKEAVELPPGNPISLNWEVLAFTFLLALLTGALFGVLPAWRASRLDLNEVLKQSSRTTSNATRSHRISRNLVIVEVALSLIVLVAASLLIQSMFRLTNASLGYQRDRLLTADLRLPANSYPKPEDALRFWGRLQSKLETLPGIQGIAFAPPLFFERGMGPVTIESAGSQPRVVSASDPESVSGGYFHVAGIPLLQGREFSDDDRAESMPVAIVNQAFASEFFPNGTELGQRIKLGKPDSKDPWLTIVGVVGSVSRPTLFEGYSQRPSVYRPLPQAPDGSLSIFIRIAGKPRAIEPEVGRAVEAVDGNLPVPTVQTVDEALSWFTSEPRFRAELFGLFSFLALILAAVGIYGVLSQRVAQRTQEIGIRIALGANRQDVLLLILGEGVKVILSGILIGVIGALALTRLLSSMLYGIGTTDPLTFGSVSLLLTGVALVACYVPARRAMHLNPLAALRCE